MALPEQQWGTQMSSWTNNASEHAVSKPILVQGGHHQNLNEVMSPKSSESNSLYVKMAENVLGSSPTTVVAAKYADAKKSKEKEGDNSNVSVINHPNGLDVSNRSNISPREKIDGGGGGNQPMMHSTSDLNETNVVAYQNATQNNIDMTNYYQDALGNSSTVGIPGSIESPSVIGDYSQMYQQQQRQPQQQQPSGNVQMMQQYALQQMNAAYTNPYFMPPNGQTDQYGQALMYSQMMPFYSYPNTWMYQGMAQAQAGQQQPNTANVNAHQRPQSTVTPPQAENGTNGLGGQPMQNNYPMLAPAPTPYFDQNGASMYLNNAARAAAMQTVRLVSPAPQMILNASGNANSLSGRVGSPPASTLYSSSPTPTNSLYTTSLLGNYPFTQPHSMSGYGNNALNSLSSGLASLNLGQNSLGQQRRDSFSHSLGPIKQTSGPGLPYYNPAAAMNMFNMSNTPPPNAWGSSNSNLFGVGSPVTGGGLFGPPGSSPATANMFQTTAPPHHPGAKLFRPNNLDRQVNRSRLLEEFRANRFPHLQLRDLANHIVEFAQDQHGSRFIQQKLERATVAEKQMVFSEVMASAQPLMTDVFGNYVIQKFFEFGTPEQKMDLVRRLRNHVLVLSLQMYGCRVIQKALEASDTENQHELAKELEGNVLKCVKDQNGNHVVQKVIETVEPKYLDFIVQAFNGQVLSLSTHPYGCRVIQRILEHCTEEQKRPILEELHDNIKSLVIDQYGNYVIQHVLEHGSPEHKARIIKQMEGDILRHSQHKFASNVIEKCVVHSNPEERSRLIAEVLGNCPAPNNFDVVSGTTGGSPLLAMMKDQYANYVVQKMLDVAEPAQRKKLMQSIRPHVQQLRKYTYGKHIITKLEKYFQKNNPQGAVDMGFGQTTSM